MALELSDPLAEIYCLSDELDKAAPLTREAMVLVQRAEGTRTRAVADALGRRAWILKNYEKDLEGAQRLYSRALDIYLELEGPTHPDAANIHNQLGVVAHRLVDLEAAISWHQKALASRRQLFPGPQGHPWICRSLAHLASIYREQGDLSRAADFYRQAAEASHAFYGATGAWTVRMNLLRAEVLLEAGFASEAEAISRVQLGPEYRESLAAGSRLVVQAEGILGAALLVQGKTEGQSLLLASVETLRSKPEGYEEALNWLERFVAEP